MKRILTGIVLLAFSTSVFAQDKFQYKCPDKKSVLPVNCLHNMQVRDVKRQLNDGERHQLCQLFIKTYLVTKKEYKQDYLLDPNTPIYQLFKANFPEIKKEEGEGGIFLEKIYKFIEAKSEHQQDIKVVRKALL